MDHAMGKEGNEDVWDNNQVMGKGEGKEGRTNGRDKTKKGKRGRGDIAEGAPHAETSSETALPADHQADHSPLDDLKQMKRVPFVQWPELGEWRNS